jgi:hypothetical protein
MRTFAPQLGNLFLRSVVTPVTTNGLMKWLRSVRSLLTHPSGAGDGGYNGVDRVVGRAYDKTNRENRFEGVSRG